MKIWLALLRQIIFLLLLLGAGYYVLEKSDYKQKTKDYVVAFLQERGMIIVDMKVDVVSPLGVQFSEVRIIDPWEATIGMLRMELVTRRLSLQNVAVKDFLGQPAVFDMEAVFGIEGLNNTIDVTLKGKPMELAADLRLSAQPRKPETTTVNLRSGSMQWGGGVLAVRNVVRPLHGGVDTPVTIEVNGVELSQLLKLLLSPAAVASGKVSGTVPLVLTADGGWRFGSGEVKALQTGAIQIPAGAIPAANEEMALLSQALTDFRYSALGLSIDSSSGRPHMRMVLEGNNPAVYGGQPIKLRVNVGGDVLEFLQTSISMARNPATVVHEHQAK